MNIYRPDSQRNPVLRWICVTILALTWGSSLARAQDDDPFGPVQDPFETRQDEFRKRQSEREKLFEKIQHQLSDGINEEERDDVLRRVAELLQTCDEAELQVIRLEYDKQAEIDVYHERLSRMSKQCEELSKELSSVRDTTYFAEATSREQYYALMEIQGWMAHALLSVDRPELQNWMLSYLADYPEVFRVLIDAANSEKSQEGESDVSQLEDAIYKLNKHRSPEIQSLAKELVGVLYPDLAQANPSPTVTSAWPIAAEPGREAERRLIQALEQPGEFVFFDIPLGELFKYLEDDYDVSILTNQKELEKSGIDLSDEVTLDAKMISLRSALNHVLQDNGLAFSIRDDAIVITSREDAEAHPTRRVYDLTGHRHVKDDGGAEIVLETLKSTMGGEVDSIVAIGNQLVVTADENGHYEIAKLITLMHRGE